MGRHLINIERSHLMNPSMNVVLKGEFKGEFKKDLFFRAVEELQRAYAVLGATIERDERGKAYLVTSNVKEIPVTILDAGTSFDKLVVSENKRIFELDKDCLLRIYVIPLLNAFSVVFISHHLLGDGKSSVMLMEALVKAYTGEKLDYVGIRLIKDSTEFQPNSAMNPVYRFYLSMLNRSWRKTKHIFGRHNYRKLFKEYQKEHTSEVYTLSLNAVELRKLHYRCKENKVTINSAVVAAFIYAQNEIDIRHENHVDRVGIGVNIREQLTFDASKLIGNYASAVSIEQGKLPAIPFGKFVEQIHKKLQKKIKDPASRLLGLQALDWLEGNLIDATYFSQYTDYENKVAQKCAKVFGYEGEPLGLGITNLGNVVLNIPHENNMESLMFIPPAAPCNDITVGIVTYQGVMQIGISYQSSSIGLDLVKRISKRAKELLVTY